MQNFKKQLANFLIKRLKSNGFKFHRRYYTKSTNYGYFTNPNVLEIYTERVEENWNNKKFIDWLLNVDNKEHSKEAEEMNKLLKR